MARQNGIVFVLFIGKHPLRKVLFPNVFTAHLKPRGFNFSANHPFVSAFVCAICSSLSGASSREIALDIRKFLLDPRVSPMDRIEKLVQNPPSKTSLEEVDVLMPYVSSEEVIQVGLFEWIFSNTPHDGLLHSFGGI